MSGGARALAGILLGLVVGATAYGLFRALTPGQLAVFAALPGIFAGLGARLGRAIGTHDQLRVIVFGTLFATVGAEMVVYRQLGVAESFGAHLLSNGLFLGMSIGFLVLGIFFGVRLLVGNDPVGDVLAHAGEAVPPGATGTPCPRCGSMQTALDGRSLELECHACGHQWRPDAVSPARDGSADDLDGTG
ncbi:MAG: hypothetical protein KC620_20035 [Myxococcales bacterium]|nr:hypothetical protein [Myxococcales bacterium]